MAKLNLTPEGANACREFADQMVKAYKNIEESNQRLKGAFDMLSDDLGLNIEKYRLYIEIVTSAQEEASEALAVLPVKLYETADAIDEWYRKHKTSVTGGS